MEFVFFDMGVSSIVVGVAENWGMTLVAGIGSIEGTIYTSIVSLVLETNTGILKTVLLYGTVPSTFFYDEIIPQKFSSIKQWSLKRKYPLKVF